jgi:hypothetical protein
MKYTVVKSLIRWYDPLQCLGITLDSYQLMEIEEKVKAGHEVRGVVKEWIIDNAGDYSGITDFMADLEFSSGNVVIDWTDPESENKFCDCYYGDY